MVKAEDLLVLAVHRWGHFLGWNQRMKVTPLKMLLGMKV